MTRRFSLDARFSPLQGFNVPDAARNALDHSLLHGDIIDAWHKNAMLVASLPFLAMLAFSELTRTRYPGFYRKINSGIVNRACFILVVGWWIVRNLI